VTTRAPAFSQNEKVGRHAPGRVAKTWTS